MKMKKSGKRLIAGALSVVLATSVFLTNTVTGVHEVQAKTTVFAGVTDKYKTTKTFTILEIVPGTGASSEYYTTFNYKPNTMENNRTDAEHNWKISKSAEMGYFIALTPNDSPYSTDQPHFKGATGVSRGGVYNDPTMQADNAAYGDALYQMYTYGLIKPDGMDSKGATSKVGEYPIFANSAILSKYWNSATPNEFDSEKRLVKGVYSNNVAGTGRYKLADGYRIDDNGNICKVTVSENKIPIEKPAVSSNSVSGNGAVSDNTPEYRIETVEILTPVTDIDKTKLQLPASATVQYVTLSKDSAGNEDGKGNLDFKRSEVATTMTEYYGLTDLSLYYSTSKEYYYRNSDWFREYVLGDNKAYQKTKIDYKTVSAKEVTTDMLDAADLVYISGQDKYFDPKTKNDITDDVLINLYNRVVHDHKALMMDYLSYSDDLRTNISKLALLLWQNDQSSLLTSALDIKNKKEELSFNTDSTRMQNLAFMDDEEIIDMLKGGLDEVVHGTGGDVGETNGNFVRGNLYVYNHHTSDFTESKVMVDALDNFANGDFATPYTATATATGFSEILNYITIYNQKSLKSTMPQQVTPAVAIQYILIADGSMLNFMKNSLRVLEIEPVPAYRYNFGRGSVPYADLDSIADEYVTQRARKAANNDDADKGKALADKIRQNRKDFVKNYLSEYYNQDIDSLEDSMLKYIDFTSMTVSEFNGRSEDLFENYDIIYIGDEIYRNLDGDSLYKLDKDKNIVYNDTNMNGNVYFGIGDLIDVRAYKGSGDARANFLLSGYIDGEKLESKDLSSSTVYQTRYQARDITKNKLEKLKDFLKSDGLIIVDQDILGYNDSKQQVINPTDKGSKSNDHGRVDNSSNLYELLMFGNGYRYDYTFAENTDGQLVGRTYKAVESTSTEKAVYENLVSAKKLSSSPEERDTYSKYVSSDRLTLIMSSVPTPYEYEYQAGKQVIDTTKIKYMEAVEDGKRVLIYQFAIGAELGSIANNNDTYKATLYFDINKDGKYSKTTEKIDDCVITNSATGGVQPAKDADGNYLLSLNTNYTLKRKLSDEYCGIIKWKLEVQSTTRTSSHATSEGYTLLKNITQESKQVNILQIGPDNLDLQKQMYDSSQTWYPYLQNVPGYEVHIKRVTIDQFEYDFNKQYAAYNQGKAAADQLTVEEYATTVYFKEFYLERNSATTQENTDTNANAIKYFTDSKGVTYKYDKDVKGVNMLVLGFGDYIQPFTTDNAIKAVSAFIDQGKPVLMSHDFMDFSPRTRQTKVLRNAVGADKYAVTQNIKVTNDTGVSYTLVGDKVVPTAVGTNTKTSLINIHTADATTLTGTTGELHKSGIYSATVATDQPSIARVESTGREVAYAPGSNKGTIVKEKQGYSNYLIDRYGTHNNTTNNNWIQASGAMVTSFDSDPSHKDYYIEKLNDGQLTEYPYRLPEQCLVSNTHSQYYELDLTKDADSDGESDVVVWYALGQSKGTTAGGQQMYDDYYGGSIDPGAGYYIYNDGNITYTGAGHGSMNGTKSVTEIQLFVNTLLAAFEVANQNPQTAFYESVDTNAKPTECIIVPYDGNVTKPNTENGRTNDAAVTQDKNGKDLYTFIDPNVETKYITTVSQNSLCTKAYFKVSDPNLIRGDKDIYVKYYLAVEKNMERGVDPTNTTKSVPAVKLYGEWLPITTIPGNGENSSVEVVDISKYIKTYEVNQTSGEFTSEKSRITTINKGLSEESLSGTVDNDENAMNAVKGIKSGMAYGLYLPMSYLNTEARFTIYLEAQTKITSVSTSGGKIVTKTEKDYQPLSVTKADLLKLY